MPGLPGSIEVVSPPDLLAYYVPFHTIPACWERNAESLAGYGTLPQGYAYYAQGTVQGYLIHRDNTILTWRLPRKPTPSRSALPSSAVCTLPVVHTPLSRKYLRASPLSRCWRTWVSLPRRTTS